MPGGALADRVGKSRGTSKETVTFFTSTYSKCQYGPPSERPTAAGADVDLAADDIVAAQLGNLSGFNCFANEAVGMHRVDAHPIAIDAEISISQV